MDSDFRTTDLVLAASLVGAIMLASCTQAERQHMQDTECAATAREIRAMSACIADVGCQHDIHSYNYLESLKNDYAHDECPAILLEPKSVE